MTTKKKGNHCNNESCRNKDGNKCDGCNCGGHHEDGNKCDGCNAEKSEAMRFGYMMKVLSLATNDSFIINAEWTDDEDIDHMIVEFAFLLAACESIPPYNLGCSVMGHGDAVGAAYITLEGNHPPLPELKDKILGWLSENGPHLGVKYHTYTLE